MRYGHGGACALRECVAGAARGAPVHLKRRHAVRVACAAGAARNMCARARMR